VNKIHVIGIGYRPFDKKSREVLLGAEVILASSRLSEVFKGYEEYESVKGKVLVISRIDELIEYMRSNAEKRSIALLASGDPLFFGIGRRVLDEFGPERVDMLPDLSSIQLAFSRIKEPWDDAFLMSLHGGPDSAKRRRLPYEIDDIPALLDAHHKIAILTDRGNNPSAIASFLNATPVRAGVPRPYGSILMHVCEKLGYADEKIASGTPAEIAAMTFADPNVVIILNNAQARKSGSAEAGNSTKKTAPGFGLTEGEISHSRGLITKDEVRAVSLHKLRLPQKGILWDIGAGSGSVSIEAARLSPGLKIYAIERNDEQVAHIEENKTRFGMGNIAITAGEAPEVLRDLPSPDRVFIGGSGGELSGIIRRVREKMPRGIVVINAVTLETLNEALLLLENNGFEPEVSQVAVSRSKIVKGQRHLSPLNPVFVIRGQRK
jgi:precorrin-6Y C5,15-methyltransferase (decarboxylating)